MKRKEGKGKGPTEFPGELGADLLRRFSLRSRSLLLSDCLFSPFLNKFLDWLNRPAGKGDPPIADLVADFSRVSLSLPSICELLEEAKELKAQGINSPEEKQKLEKRFSSFLLTLLGNLPGSRLPNSIGEMEEGILRQVERYFPSKDSGALSLALERLNAAWGLEKSAIVRSWQDKKTFWLAQTNISDEEKASLGETILARGAPEEANSWIILPLGEHAELRDLLLCHPGADNLLLTREWEGFSRTISDIWMKNRLQEQLREDLEKIGNLFRYESSLLLVQDRGVMIKEIADAARNLIKADTVIFLEYVEEENCLRPIYALHPHAEKVYRVSIPLGEGISGLAASRKALIMTLDPWEDERVFRFSGRAEGSETALLSIPLLERDQLFGVLTLARCEGRFEQSDLLLLQSFGQLLRVLLENLRFGERDRRKAQETQALLNLSHEINSASDLESLFQVTVRQGSLLFQAKGAMLFIKQPGGQSIELKANFGEESNFPLPGEMQQAIEALVRNPLTASFLLKGERETTLPSLALPLQAGRELLGTLFFLREEGEWQSDEILRADTFASQVGLALKNKYLMTQLEEAAFQTVTALWAAFDAKDRYSAGHVEKVTDYGLAIAEDLKLASRERTVLRYALLLHDIGKIGIPEHILNKPGALNPEEWELMKLHPAIGATILKSAAFLEEVVPIVLHHQERWDGSGYPNGLKGEEIPLLARIVAVADAYHAMTSSRPYRAAKTMEEALQEIERGAGSQFDPQVTRAFIRIFRRRGSRPGK